MLRGSILFSHSRVAQRKVVFFYLILFRFLCSFLLCSVLSAHPFLFPEAQRLRPTSHSLWLSLLRALFQRSFGTCTEGTFRPMMSSWKQELQSALIWPRNAPCTWIREVPIHPAKWIMGQGKSKSLILSAFIDVLLFRLSQNTPQQLY